MGTADEDHKESDGRVRSLGRYEVLKVIGPGDHGEVYLARGVGVDKRLVALKCLSEQLMGDQEFVRRFRSAVEIAKGLEHPNFVRVLGVDDIGGRIILVMEYIDRGSLRDILDNATNTKLSPEKAVAIVAQVCAALEYAHDKRVIHWSIKPESILLTNDDVVKLDAFDLVKVMAEAQAGGDHDTDVSSLGAVLYEMLTGSSCPKDTTKLDIVKPRKLGKAVRRALVSDEDEPYRNVSQFCKGIKKSLPRSGGVLSALKSTGDLVKEKLTIRWEYPIRLKVGYRPVAIKLNRDGDVYLLLSSQLNNAGLICFYDKRLAGKSCQEYSITGTPIQAFLSDNGGILYIVVNDNNDKNNKLKISEWDTLRKKMLQDWTIPGDRIRQVSRIRNDGRFLLVEENQLTIWNPVQDQPKQVDVGLEDKEVILAAHRRGDGSIRVFSSLLDGDIIGGLGMEISRLIVHCKIICRSLVEKDDKVRVQPKSEMPFPDADAPFLYLGFHLDSSELFFFRGETQSVVSIKAPYNCRSQSSGSSTPARKLKILYKNITEDSLIWGIGNSMVAVVVHRQGKRFLRIYPLRCLSRLLGAS